MPFSRPYQPYRWFSQGADRAGCAAQKAQIRAALPQTNPDVAKVLNLSQSEAAALFELLIRNQETALAASCGSDEERRRAAATAANRAQSQQAQIQALLGAKYQQWEEYLPTREGRTRVNQLRARRAQLESGGDASG